jgi:hypothetical protein
VRGVLAPTFERVQGLLEADDLVTAGEAALHAVGAYDQALVELRDRGARLERDSRQ